MPIKNIVIGIETAYLQDCAKKRGVSRTYLVRTVMEKVISDQLVTAILDDGEQRIIVPVARKYRRFACSVAE